MEAWVQAIQSSVPPRAKFEVLVNCLHGEGLVGGGV